MRGGLRRAAPWLAGLLLVYAAAAVMRRDDPPYRLENEEIWALVTGNTLTFGTGDHTISFTRNGRYWLTSDIRDFRPLAPGPGGHYRIASDLLCIDDPEYCYTFWSDGTAAWRHVSGRGARVPFRVTGRVDSWGRRQTW